MNWPKVKVVINERAVVVDAFTVSFFMGQSQELLAPHIAKALDLYVALVGPEALKFYIDDEGDAAPLTPESLALFKSTGFYLSDEESAVTLLDSDFDVPGYYFKYYGTKLPEVSAPAYRNHAVFRFPTRLLDEKGLAPVLDFARQVAGFLPFTFGYGSPALAYDHFIQKALGHAFRHPGFDVINPSAVSVDLGDRAAGVYWLSFLGEALTTALGGIQLLRQSLAAPVAVEPIGEGGAVITLGPEPEVGDLDGNNHLPLHRALARVLEPRLHIAPITYFRDDDGAPDHRAQLRWYRRFLE